MALMQPSRMQRRVLALLVFVALVFVVYQSPLARKSQPQLAEGGVTPTRPGSDYASGFSEPGAFKFAAGNYSKTLVVTTTKNEDVSWITQSFENSESIKTTVYVADDPSAPFHPPKNKGHEVMIYLTYIIDHYDHLADVNIFLHSHRYAWHNNELLDHDAVQIVTRLSGSHVQRHGYMNLRCHWDPGCPDWLHPGTAEGNVNKQEEKLLASTWSVLFPSDPVPKVLAQPCCAQFAVSKDRIQALPKARYEFFRDWLLKTPLSDYLSGRIWEYIWHYLFTGQNVCCPAEHVCYCEGFGICFGGEEPYKAWWDRVWDKRILEDQLKDWHFRQEAIATAQQESRVDDLKTLEVPEVGKDEELEKKIADLDAWLQVEKWKAMIKGDVERDIAQKAGR